MADIAKCTAPACPLASTCYRKQARSSEFQYYSQFDYVIGPCGPVCGAYWPTERVPGEHAADVELPK